ncbi:hypothetical protein JOQ06_008886, partial [Pogonophryne albipinna]
PFMLSFLPPWVNVVTQTLQPLQNINALLMPSHSDSPKWGELELEEDLNVDGNEKRGVGVNTINTLNTDCCYRQLRGNL